MDSGRKVVSAAELDAMSPDQRASVLGEHLVTNLEDIPSEFRDHVVATAQRLAAERRPAEG